MPPLLVIDDDEAIRRLIVAVLRVEGFDVLPSSSGADALELIRTLGPPLIIVDLMMAGIDGQTTVARARQAGYDGLVVVISAHPQAREIARSMEADACLQKPFDPALLVITVERLLKERRPFFSETHGP